MSSIESAVATAVAATSTPQPAFALTAPHTSTAMRVTKRDGRNEPVDVAKIVRAVARCADGLTDVDPMRVAL